MNNTQKNKVAMTPTLKKKMLPFKIALGIIILILLAILISWYIFADIIRDQPYFYQHFAGAISLVLFGVICIILPVANRNRIAGDTRGDSLMIGLGFVCFILAIITIVGSYIF